jgi:uncharacterized protein (TIGR03000 family)
MKDARDRAAIPIPRRTHPSQVAAAETCRAEQVAFMTSAETKGCGMRKFIGLAATSALLAIAALLCSADSVQAQRGGRGGGGRGGGGRAVGFSGGVRAVGFSGGARAVGVSRGVRVTGVSGGVRATGFAAGAFRANGFPLRSGLYGGFYQPYYGYGIGYGSYAPLYGYGLGGYGLYAPYYGGVAMADYNSFYPDSGIALQQAQGAQALQQAQGAQAPPSSQRPPPDGTAHLQLTVPENADVVIDGAKTTQTGTTREFVSPVLTPGKRYVYNVTVRYTDAKGKQVEDTRDIRFQANDWFAIDFTRPAPAPAPTLPAPKESKDQ